MNILAGLIVKLPLYGVVCAGCECREEYLARNLATVKKALKKCGWVLDPGRGWICGECATKGK